MKVLLNYACDLEDIPNTVGDLLGNLSRELEKTQDTLGNAITESYDNSVTEALNSIDNLRRNLNKIDQRLMDYSTILAGYMKTTADIKTGIDPTLPEVALKDDIESQEND